jgi:hypothetical protein
MLNEVKHLVRFKTGLSMAGSYLLRRQNDIF